MSTLFFVPILRGRPDNFSLKVSLGESKKTRKLALRRGTGIGVQRPR
jgi:hypothetical protein